MLTDDLLAVLNRGGGGFTLRELCYQTKARPAEVLDALIALEEQSLAGPYSWCSAPVFESMHRWAHELLQEGKHHAADRSAKPTESNLEP